MDISYIFNNGICYEDICDPGFYLENGVCEKCTDFCNSCTGLSSCDECA